jgi:hypothetical protein
MSVVDWFRRLFSPSTERAPDIEEVRESTVEMETIGGGIGPGIPGTTAAAEVAEAEIETEEAPPDPDSEPDLAP